MRNLNHQEVRQRLSAGESFAEVAASYRLDVGTLRSRMLQQRKDCKHRENKKRLSSYRPQMCSAGLHDLRFSGRTRAMRCLQCSLTEPQVDPEREARVLAHRDRIDRLMKELGLRSEDD